MARIVVMSDSPTREDLEIPFLLDEQVRLEHLEDEHSSSQIIQRVAWAVRDAETRGPSATEPGRAP